jgi:hypothetical protein
MAINNIQFLSLVPRMLTSGPLIQSLSLTLSLFFLTFIKQTRLFSERGKRERKERGKREERERGRGGLARLTLPRGVIVGSLRACWRGGGANTFTNPPPILQFSLFDSVLNISLNLLFATYSLSSYSSSLSFSLSPLFPFR